MREKLIEQKLRNGVKAKGGLALKFVSPGTVGVPDRIVLAPGGRIYFVELKAPGKSMSPKQAKMAEVFERLGHKVTLIDSFDQIEKFMNEMSTSSKLRVD